MPLTKIGEFSTSYLQILDEQGNVDRKLDPKLPDDELLQLYRAMYLSREADQRMLKLQRQGRIGTFGPGTGQEAAFCGPTFALTDKDWLLGSFREPGARLMRGEPLSNALLYYNGYEEGNTLSPDKRTLPIAVIVASQTLHAVGVAYSMRYQGEKDTAVLVFLGDGASSQGDFHEALNFASVWQVPVVFICQNNQWAISVPRSKQTHAQTIAQRAIAYDMPGIQVDGNDALAMYQATKEALDRARSGGGPALIEAVTYRLMMHTTADDPKKYRTEDEEKEWWSKEPLIRFRKYLENKGVLDKQGLKTIEAETKQYIDEEIKKFEAQSDFKPDALFDHVFGTKHREIEKQRAEFLRTLKKEAADA
jgi:pyruvate dehydrogenase E1 component alpha subunit